MSITEGFSCTINHALTQRLTREPMFWEGDPKIGMRNDQPSSQFSMNPNYGKLCFVLHDRYIPLEGPQAYMEHAIVPGIQGKIFWEVDYAYITMVQYRPTSTIQRELKLI